MVVLLVRFRMGRLWTFETRPKQHISNVTQWTPGKARTSWTHASSHDEALAGCSKQNLRFERTCNFAHVIACFRKWRPSASNCCTRQGFILLKFHNSCKGLKGPQGGHSINHSTSCLVNNSNDSSHFAANLKSKPVSRSRLRTAFRLCCNARGTNRGGRKVFS